MHSPFYQRASYSAWYGLKALASPDHNCFFSVVTTLDDTGVEVLQKFKRGRSFGYAIDHDNAILSLLLWLRRDLISLDVIAACTLRNCPCPHYGEWRDPDWRRAHGIIEHANALD